MHLDPFAVAENGSRIVAGHWVPCSLLAGAAREGFVEALHSAMLSVKNTK